MGFIRSIFTLNTIDHRNFEHFLYLFNPLFYCLNQKTQGLRLAKDIYRDPSIDQAKIKEAPICLQIRNLQTRLNRYLEQQQANDGYNKDDISKAIYCRIKRRPQGLREDFPQCTLRSIVDLLYGRWVNCKGTSKEVSLNLQTLYDTAYNRYLITIF